MDQASYLDLYLMGSAGSGRKRVQILNQFDGCCFWGLGYQTYQPAMIEAMQRLSHGTYEVYLNTTAAGEHSISKNAQVSLLRALGRPVFVVDSVYEDSVTHGPGWGMSPSSAYDRHQRQAVYENRESLFVYHLRDLPPGIYRVATTWLEGENRAQNAAFSMWDAETPRLEVRLDVFLLDKVLIRSYCFFLESQGI